WDQLGPKFARRTRTGRFEPKQRTFRTGTSGPKVRGGLRKAEEPRAKGHLATCLCRKQEQGSPNRNIEARDFGPRLSFGQRYTPGREKPKWPK
ncbi:hypothetical protein KI387_000314, partial [Taxus chinensis]